MSPQSAPRPSSGNTAPGAVDDAGGSRSVRRALDILDLLSTRGEPMSVAEIVAALRIPKSTAYELVRTLADSGYVERMGRQGNMFLGRKLFELGMQYRAKIDLLEEGAAVTEGLRDATGETVQFSVLDNSMMLVLMKEEGNQPLRIVSRVGSRIPVNWSAAGRLLVSDLDDAALRRLLQETVRQSPAGRAVTDVETLVQQIRKFRQQGYAIEINESNEHAGCVAAPVIDARGQCVAALSIVAPEQRLGRADRDKLIAEVRSAAARLSRRLGAPAARV
jgi:DNA-binding IclR family transcriptional regulator